MQTVEYDPWSMFRCAFVATSLPAHAILACRPPAVIYNLTFDQPHGNRRDIHLYCLVFGSVSIDPIFDSSPEQTHAPIAEPAEYY